VLVSSLTAFGGCSGHEAPSEPRHVLLVSIDTLRADYLGTYGNPVVQTPHIDALAASGAVFERHISSAPTTLLSHTALMTGNWPHTHRVPRNGFVVPEENQMLAEVLSDAGWRTAGFIGGHPLRRSYGFAQGFQHYDEEVSPVERGVRGTRFTRRAEKVTDSVLAWLDAEPASADARLFLFVHYFDVHAPYIAPEPYRDMYRSDRLPIRGTMQNVSKVQRGLRHARVGAFEESAALSALYAGEVTYTDHELGRLFDGLENRGLWDDMLVIVTSDHEESMDEHPEYESWGHGVEVFDTTVHTPLIIRRPNDFGAGRRYTELVSNIDVMPTVLALVGLPVPRAVEGISFDALLSGAPFSARTETFSEATRQRTQLFEPAPGWTNSRMARAIRVADRKLILHPPTDQRWLYDPSSDPLEQSELLQRDTAERKTAQELATRLEAWSANARDQPASRDESDESLEMLRALGYVEGEEDPSDAGASLP
jgi:arylsulfatase